jgi:hypothetical protein
LNVCSSVGCHVCNSVLRLFGFMWKDAQLVCRHLVQDAECFNVLSHPTHIAINCKLIHIF